MFFSSLEFVNQWLEGDKLQEVQGVTPPIFGVRNEHFPFQLWHGECFEKLDVWNIFLNLSSGKLTWHWRISSFYRWTNCQWLFFLEGMHFPSSQLCQTLKKSSWRLEQLEIFKLEWVSPKGNPSSCCTFQKAIIFRLGVFMVSKPSHSLGARWHTFVLSRVLCSALWQGAVHILCVYMCCMSMHETPIKSPQYNWYMTELIVQFFLLEVSGLQRRNSPCLI